MVTALTPSDPLAGLSLPPGEPGALRAVAARYHLAAETAAHAAAGPKAEADSTIGSAWVGGAANRAAWAMDDLSRSVQVFTSASSDVGTWLTAAATGWEDAKEMWGRAQRLATEAVADEEAHRTAMARAASSAARSGNLIGEVDDVAGALGLDGYTSPLRGQARTLAQQAIEHFNQATTIAVGRLAGLPGPPSASAALEDLAIDESISDITSPAQFAQMRTILVGMLATPSSISQGDIGTFISALAALTPAERGQLVSDLAGNEVITNLGQALRDEAPPSLWDQLFGGGDPPISANQRLQLYTLLLASASPAAIKSLVTELPGVNPALSGVSGWDKGNVDTFFGPGGAVLDHGTSVNPADVEQGAIGDCYFLASLIAATQANPSFVENHIHDNGNGTVSVTLYEDGHPVVVTVPNTVPTTDSGVFWSSYGETSGVDGAAGNPSLGDWPSIYEKAYAQLRGGYGVIDQGGYGAQGLGAVTGMPTTTVNGSQEWYNPLSWGNTTPSVNVDQVRSLVSSGHAVVVGTHGTGNDSSDSNGVLIENHEYVVQSVHSNGTVTLRNPWNPNDTPTLPWSKIESQAQEVVWTNGPV